MNEKMLMKIEEKNIFKKVINFIKRIFSKKEEKDIKPHIENNSFLSDLKENGEILNIQKKFESGELKEYDLAETEKDNLMKLYNKQIEELKQDIENYNRALESYKEKILVMKSKMNN